MGPATSPGTGACMLGPGVEGDHDLLKALALVLGTAGAASILSKRLHQPVVLGYIVAGLIVGPKVGIPLFADPQVVHTLSELGVVLLMFALGLEFSLHKLVRVGPGVGLTAVIQCSLLFWLGFAVGRLFGWTMLESLFTGAILAISSTTIIAKAFDDLGVRGRMRELVVGVLVVEDLIAILLMAMLTTVASGAGLSALSLLGTAARLGAFLLGLLVLGLLVVPRGIRWVIGLKQPDLTLVCIVALCFGVALLASALGYSVALGAFLAGSIIAESGEDVASELEKLVHPVRDLFGAVFFVSVGMMMDPSLMLQHWLPIVVLTVVVVLGKICSVSLGAFLAGNGARTSIRAGMSLAQIGEFSFIIAALGLSLGATRDFVYPVAVAVSAITTLLTPWLIRASGPVAEWVDRKLPRPLQTLGALYGSWLESLKAPERKAGAEVTIRQLVTRLALDAAVLGAIVVGGTLGSRSIRAYLVDRHLTSPEVAVAITIGVLGLLAAPFCIGIVRVGRKLGKTLADLALPPAEGSQLDLAAASRHALIVTLQLTMLLLVGIPLVAITQPFLPGFHGAEVLFGILVLVAIGAWRTARDLQGHVRAAAQVLAELLSRQSREPASATPAPPGALAAVLRGLGEPVAIGVGPDSPAAERTLSDLNFRGHTGATVLAISRGEGSLLVPTADERLHAGDILAVAGTREAIASARALVAGTEDDDIGEAPPSKKPRQDDGARGAEPLEQK
jgi:monovalent cation:H+ antiporter-2, CPA2 family